MNKTKTKEILTILKEIIPNPVCELNYSNPFELLIATVLSQQTKDQRVNEITPLLFNKYPNPLALSKADINDVEKIISPLGLAKMKAKNVISLSYDLATKYNSTVPESIEELIQLNGVGRKTASVLLVEAFKFPAVPGDTHVLRVSNRLGLSKSNDPIIVENDLKKLIDINEWIISHHLFIHFGRYHCLSKNPKCTECRLRKYCIYDKKKI